MAATTQFPAAGVRYGGRTRPTSPVSRETGVFITMCTVGLIVYAFLQLLVVSEVAATVKSIVFLEAQQKRLLVQYDQLAIEAERLQAPASIEVSAVRLGLKPMTAERTP